MKELTIRQKAQAYNEALKRAKDALNDETISSNTIAYLQDIFPELKESEDERIRKLLIRLFRSNTNEKFDDVSTQDIIAWLEKQKEFVSADFDDVWETADCDELTAPLEKYSKDAIKKMCHAWYDKGIELERRNWLKKQGEHANFLSKIQVGDKVTRNEGGVLVNISQLERVAKPRRVKPVHKVKPKFHEGDWVIQERVGTYKVVEICKTWYEVIGIDGNRYSISFLHENDCHHWTIQDAKDGDVLVTIDDENDERHPFIYKGCLDPNHPNSPVAYCGIDTEGLLCCGTGNFWWTDKKVQPATKEQRDLLFQKMKEAGYDCQVGKENL